MALVWHLNLVNPVVGVTLRGHCFLNLGALGLHSCHREASKSNAEVLHVCVP